LEILDEKVVGDVGWKKLEILDEKSWSFWMEKLGDTG
jgi:hypothetical protein